MRSLLASLRVAFGTILICATGYVAVVLAVARLIAPAAAAGDLVTGAQGEVIGSRRIAQAFTRPEYFWPRPSAVGYDAAAAGGSNTSPTDPRLTLRAESLIVRYGATPVRPLPPELAASSGSGLDPHISEHAALYQAERVARARGLSPSVVEGLIHRRAVRAGGLLTPDPIVNVLELNLALDSLPSPQLTSRREP